jgi:hypothetical protein
MTQQEAATETSAFFRSLSAGKHGGLFKGFLGLPVGLGRMFHRLLGVLVSGLVIFLAVADGGSTVSVSRKFVELSGSHVRIVWHDRLPE